MEKRPTWRAAVAAAALLILLSAAAWTSQLELPPPPSGQGVVMGVSILSQQAYDALSPGAGGGFDLLLDGESAALDTSAMTLYVPVSPGTAAHAIPSVLSIRSETHRLCFAPDPAFDDLDAAIRESHAFTLLAVDGKDRYTPYSVIFTTLPVISLSAAQPGDLSDPYAVHEGSLIAREAGASPKVSKAEWHRRGNTTLLFKKGSFKITLHNALGHTRDLSLLGLGEDDDWILNAMGMDDLKLREKFIADLYNDMQAGSALRMSAGAYAEVIIDGQYMGLYLLQRRVDAKYLGLPRSRAVVLKGETPSGDPPDVQETYTIVSSPLTQEKTYALAQDILNLSGSLHVDMDSWLDAEMLVLLGSLHDNSRYKNCFYILEPQAQAYRLSFLLWDTDVSFAIRFSNEAGFVLHDAQAYTPDIRHRREYDQLRARYPDLDAQIAARWTQLRGGLFAQSALLERLDALSDTLAQSGALSRDRALWGTRYENRDTVEAMRLFICRRLEQLDAALGAAAGVDSP